MLFLCIHIRIAMIILQILILIAGLALILFGAEILVNGASSIARKAGLSEFVIGLTIVGMGTSAPEFVVSMIGAIGGNADVAVGNVIGSNIFNSLLILGTTAVIMPMGMSRSIVKRDIPINLAVAIILLLLGMSGVIFGIGDNGLGRAEGAILLILFATYIWFSFKNDSQIEAFESGNHETAARKTWLSVVMVLGGLASEDNLIDALGNAVYDKGYSYEKVKDDFEVDHVRVYGDSESTMVKVAVFPGSGSSGIDAACMEGCDALITGDISHHDGTDALEKGISIIDAGHYGIEKLFIGFMYRFIGDKIKEIEAVEDKTGDKAWLI